jgi:hypothetical protein
MLGMVPYHRPKSGHITCYLNRTYHVLLTAKRIRSCQSCAFRITSAAAAPHAEKAWLSPMARNRLPVEKGEEMLGGRPC